jgi:large subunit ribosomal protein L20
MVGWTVKKYRKLAKGFFGRMKNCLRVMVPKVERKLKFAYRDRRVRPRNIRT